VHRGTTRRQNDDYFGYHVNLCARIAETATGSQVLATANVLAGVDLPDLDLVAGPAGELQAKGVASPVDLFLVRRDAATAQSTGLLAG
jgi:class 3 adenylate cyclase